ncbi:MULTISPECIES: pseudaminic acid synthase [Prochlorococcus]|uniref:pseudaminic acid synthase n=1 Tax=Prochlorococcus TaxID=1218 RepID=UPI00053378F9|nr:MULTISPECIES: pseudaminic acid synthase [Prochlorococcus]KGG12096.1 N-acetylneuraminate synthase [Prochlorococcus sp. MIT 0601]
MFEINGKEIGLEKPPYIIAELSANHNGSIVKAKETIRYAKDCGADAIKLQTYNADSMTINCDMEDFIIKEGLWDGYKLFDLYEEASTPYDWHHELFNFAKEIGITIFSTPFDEEAADLLENLDVPAYKIASFELTDLQLIEYVAKKGKPMLISTGMASLEEISEAIDTAFLAGCKDILLFHCISSYPTPTSEANIKTIDFLREKFNVEIGLSDHTRSNTSALAAISLGAVAIEKHFIISREDKGPDSDFSIEPKELKELVLKTKSCWEALGTKELKRSPLEIKNKIFRRSLYFVKDIKAGEVITKDHVRRIRPGYGLAPKYLDQIINKTVSVDLVRGDRVSWDVINKSNFN